MACGIESLPSELLLIIIAYACNSQRMYLSQLLVSKRFNALVKYDGLRHTPIRINTHSLRTFSEFVITQEMGEYVRYLWINSTSPSCSEVVQACFNLVSLACSKVVLYALSTPLPSYNEFRHTQLTELTIFDNWNSWDLLEKPIYVYAPQIFRQITHLRLQGYVSFFLPSEMFPSLTHYSCTYHNAEHMADQVLTVSCFPKLESIAITTYYWKDEPADTRTKDLSLIDRRIKFVFFGPNEPGEFTLWCGRARKTDCLWTVEEPLRRIL